MKAVLWPRGSFGGITPLAARRLSRQDDFGTMELSFPMKQSGYYFFEMAHAVLGPARAASDAMRLFYRNPLNPLANTTYGRTISAACELFERTTRRYGKPIFDLPQTVVNGRKVDVMERVVWQENASRAWSTTPNARHHPTSQPASCHSNRTWFSPHLKLLAALGISRVGGPSSDLESFVGSKNTK